VDDRERAAIAIAANPSAMMPTYASILPDTAEIIPAQVAGPGRPPSRAKPAPRWSARIASGTPSANGTNTIAQIASAMPSAAPSAIPIARTVGARRPSRRAASSAIVSANSAYGPKTSAA